MHAYRHMGGSGGGGSIDEGGKQTGRDANPFKGPASRTCTLNPISEPEFGNPNPGFESLKPKPCTRCSDKRSLRLFIELNADFRIKKKIFLITLFHQHKVHFLAHCFIKTKCRDTSSHRLFS